MKPATDPNTRRRSIDGLHAAFVAKARSQSFSDEPKIYAHYLEETIWLLLSKYDDSQRDWVVEIYGLDPFMPVADDAMAVKR